MLRLRRGSLKQPVSSNLSTWVLQCLDPALQPWAGPLLPNCFCFVFSWYLLGRDLLGSLGRACFVCAHIAEGHRGEGCRHLYSADFALRIPSASVVAEGESGRRTKEGLYSTLLGCLGDYVREADFLCCSVFHCFSVFPLFHFFLSLLDFRVCNDLGPLASRNGLGWVRDFWVGMCHLFPFVAFPLRLQLGEQNVCTL